VTASRKLAAILAADVVGFSRLTGADEDRTLARLRALRSDLIDATIAEGSVRKAGGRVRITAQLIDATTGGHLWAERFDRDLTDIFEVLYKTT